MIGSKDDLYWLYSVERTLPIYEVGGHDFETRRSHSALISPEYVKRYRLLGNNLDKKGLEYIRLGLHPDYAAVKTVPKGIRKGNRRLDH